MRYTLTAYISCQINWSTSIKLWSHLKQKILLASCNWSSCIVYVRLQRRSRGGDGDEGSMKRWVHYFQWFIILATHENGWPNVWHMEVNIVVSAAERLSTSFFDKEINHFQRVFICSFMHICLFPTWIFREHKCKHSGRLVKFFELFLSNSRSFSIL